MARKKRDGPAIQGAHVALVGFAGLGWWLFGRRGPQERLGELPGYASTPTQSPALPVMSRPNDLDLQFDEQQEEPIPLPRGFSKSQNGWPASPSPALLNVTPLQVRVRRGVVSVPLRAEVHGLFRRIIEFWDSEIEPVNVGDGPHGHAWRSIRGGDKLSNHASGTAIDLNPTRHPQYKRGTVSASQAKMIREMAASLGLRWGGDYSPDVVDEMHFEVASPPPISAINFTARAARSVS